MNRSHRLSQGAKKVTPPSIPSFSNPRGSGSSFGSDVSFDQHQQQQHSADHHQPMMLSTFSRTTPNGGESGTSPASSPGKEDHPSCLMATIDKPKNLPTLVFLSYYVHTKQEKFMSFMKYGAKIIIPLHSGQNDHFLTHKK